MASPSSAAGWYPDPAGTRSQRYFDGSSWTEHYAHTLDSDQRTEMLDEVVDQWSAYGWRVDSRTPFQAVMLQGANPNHVLHAILVIITCGFWLIIWAYLGMTTQVQRRTLRIDKFGTIRSLDQLGNEAVVTQAASS